MKKSFILIALTLLLTACGSAAEPSVQEAPELITTPIPNVSVPETQVTAEPTVEPTETIIPPTETMEEPTAENEMNPDLYELRGHPDCHWSWEDGTTPTFQVYLYSDPLQGVPTYDEYGYPDGELDADTSVTLEDMTYFYNLMQIGVDNEVVYVRADETCLK